MRAAGVSFRGWGGFRPEEGKEGKNKSFWQRRGKLLTGSSRAIYADPSRLAKAGDTKKAPGPPCVLPYQVHVLKVITPPPPQFGMSITRTHPWPDRVDIRVTNDVRTLVACMLARACICSKYTCSNPPTTCAPAPARLPQSSSMHGTLTSPCICRWVLSRLVEDVRCQAAPASVAGRHCLTCAHDCRHPVYERIMHIRF